MEESGRGVGGTGGQESKQNLCNQQQDVRGCLQLVRAQLRPPRRSCILGINPYLVAWDLQNHPKYHLTLGGQAVHEKTPTLARLSAKSPNMHWKAQRSPAICLSVLSSLFVHIRESSLRDRIWGLGLALLCCSYTTLNGSHLFSHRGWLIRVSCTHIMHCQNNSSG